MKSCGHGWAALSRAVLLCLALLAGCQPIETRVEYGHREGIFYIANGLDPSNLDPHTITGLAEFNVVEALFEGLVGQDPNTLKPIPRVARTWEISPDGRTYQFHLDPDARWSNGDPVTADDFAFSFQRILSPALGAQYASELYILKGAQDYHQGRTTDFDSVGVRALDPHTLELEFSSPMPPSLALGKVAHGTWFPVHRPTILAHGRMDERDTRWTRPGNLVSNGPFKLTEWNVNSHLSLEPNPHHPERDSLRLNGLVFVVTPNAQTTERLFRTGMLHATNTVPPGRIDYYRENDPESLQSAPAFATYYLLLNTTVPPLDRPEVRRALAMAINREDLVTYVSRAGERPAYSFVPPGLPGWETQNWFEYDPEAARALLQSAGIDLSSLPTRSLQLLFNISEINTAVAEAVSTMLREELGLALGTTSREWRAYLEERRMRNFQIMRAAWIGDYPDPMTFLGLWTSNSTNNVTGWHNERYDALLQEASATLDPDHRYALLQEAESILMDEMPIIPLYFLNKNYLLDPAVTGWASSLLDRRCWRNVDFKPAEQ